MLSLALPVLPQPVAVRLRSVGHVTALFQVERSAMLLLPQPRSRRVDVAPCEAFAGVTVTIVVVYGKEKAKG